MYNVYIYKHVLYVSTEKSREWQWNSQNAKSGNITNGQWAVKIVRTT